MKMKYLLIFVPISIVLHLLDLKAYSFAATVLSIIPLSSGISSFTASISDRFGDKVGGLVNATTGNLPELFICFFALRSGMFELVKAGLIGSIIGNLLLVLGICIFLGGLKFREQTFNKTMARTNFSLFFLALSAIIIISIYRNVSIPSSNLNKLSFGVACVLIVVYILGLVFSLITHRNIFVAPDDEEEALEKMDKKRFMVIKAVITLALIIVESEMLVSNVEYIMERFKLSESFLGIIIVPFVGNIVEYSTAVMMALKNRISLCIEIAVGSGIQISLLVFPLLVLLGGIISSPLNFVFNSYHITSLIIASGLSFFVFQDGKTYWIEGAILLACYFIVALGYFFM